MRALVVVAVAGTAFAQPEPFDVRGPRAAETAKKLFDEGRVLLAENKHDAACKKFRASWRLDQASGTALNLAECEERAGAYREAWALFDAAARAAERKDSSTRASFARERANALVPKLARVQIRIAESTTDIEIYVDENRLVTAATVVDYVMPGTTFVVAAKRGRRSHRFTRVAPVATETLTIDLPPMDHGELAAPPPTPEPDRVIQTERYTTGSIAGAITCWTLSAAALGWVVFGDAYRGEVAIAGTVTFAASAGFVLFGEETVYVRVKASSSGATASLQLSF